MKSIDRSRSRTHDLPGGPTTKNISAINSLLNMAAFRSLMLILLACQLGSIVEALALLKLIGLCCCCWLSSGWVISGDVGTLLFEGGCVIWMMSPDPSWLSTYKLGVGLWRPVFCIEKEISLVTFSYLQKLGILQLILDCWFQKFTSRKFNFYRYFFYNCKMLVL